jgi:hypothetical protein
MQKVFHQSRRWFEAEVDWPGVMNPPYGREIGKWVKKAFEEAQRNSELVVCLLPARTDTQWWHEYCMRGQIAFIKGRLKFGGAKNSAPSPSALVCFSRYLIFAMKVFSADPICHPPEPPWRYRPVANRPKNCQQSEVIAQLLLCPVSDGDISLPPSHIPNL